ncbi:S66 peptidase family protein [Streptomyces sp. NPDC005576]|uniref:S66 family peptidase n=1 Tax=unclassified Streptomyces TaxID=2593676 RepID=UPI00340EFEB6
MTIRYPRPLRPGDRVAVTSPSSGVPERLRGRLDAAVRVVEARGYEVVVGACMDGARHVSAPAGERAAEFEAFLTDPGIRAVVPPWGGETAIDVVPLIDWEKVAAAEPTWVVGYSDMATLITPLTLLSGTATLHGDNLMDTPYRTPEGLLSWLDIVELETGSRFTQSSPGRYRSPGWDDWAASPGKQDLGLDRDGRWTRLDGGAGDVDVTGRLVGGCIETLCNLAGSPYLDVRGFARSHAPEGLVVYVEACEDNAFTICRNLHGMRINGFFDHAKAVVVARTSAPDDATMTQHEAVLDALGTLGVPIVADVECGHVYPHMPFVNGALTRVVHTADRSDVIQSLV